MERVNYLLNLMGKDIKDLNLEFQDVEAPNIFKKLSSMLESLPITDLYESETTIVQQRTEESIKEIYKSIISSHKHHNAHFEKENHIAWIENIFQNNLPPAMESLDCNHPWMLYWLINSGHLMNHKFDEEIYESAAEKLQGLVVDDGKGGIAGGMNQLGHTASTYAGILTLISLKEYELLFNIRHNLYDWFMSLKQPDGSFIMLENGEADTRSTYCVLVICSLLDIITPELITNTLEWVVKAQTYEGGFSGIHDTEAHGGYTFCAVASLMLLLGRDAKSMADFRKSLQDTIDLPNLMRWLSFRQMQLEGGLSGRANKLVDSCYSFWVGASLAMIEAVTSEEIFDKNALKIYILNCAQRPEGGFKDKPKKNVDYYHTNYSLAGLSVAEHKFSLEDISNEKNTPDHFGYLFNAIEIDDDFNTDSVHPIFGIPISMVNDCKTHFSLLNS